MQNSHKLLRKKLKIANKHHGCYFSNSQGIQPHSSEKSTAEHGTSGSDELDQPSSELRLLLPSRQAVF